LYAPTPASFQARGDPATWLPEDFPDVDGNVCGRSPDTINVPFVYFCRDAALDELQVKLQWPICRRSCPGALETQEDLRRSALCPVATGIGEWELRPVADYGAERQGSGVICMPLDPPLRTTFTQGLQSFGADGPTYSGLQGLLRVTLLVGFPATMATLFALGYLHMLRSLRADVAYKAVVACYIVAALGPGIAGVHLYIRAGSTSHPRASGNTIVGAYVLLAFAAVFSCLALFAQRSLEFSIVFVRAACDCIHDMPALRTEPIVMALVRMLVMLLMIPGFICVLAARNIVPPPWQDVFIIWWLSALVWSMEFLSALSCFAVSFATQCWFFSDDVDSQGERNVPPSALKKGHVWGLRFHSGTIALGSFVMPWARIVRTCVPSLRYFDNQAYMDVAMHSSSFIDAVVKTELVMGPRSCLGRAIPVQLGGLGAISVIGVVTTYFLLGDLFEPALLVPMAAIASFLTAFPFMAILDQVSGTIIYCGFLDKSGTCLQNFPWRTQELLARYAML